MHCGTRKQPGQGCHVGPGYGPPHGPARARAGPCGCGCGSHACRQFQTQEETVGRLERYLEDLQKEAQAVEERLATLKVE